MAPGLLRAAGRKRFAGALPLSRIRRAGVHRTVFASVLTLLFDDGTIVGVETMRGRRLRALRPRPSRRNRTTSAR